ncbi:MAG: ATP-binding cassette domain-containing protein, partial [Candidatus Omnitrophota bacterium]
MNRQFLAAKDLHKIYRRGRKEVRAVNGIDLDIKCGSSVAIIGPSGAGKSTLLHMLGGLDKPTSGKILLEDKDMYKLPDGERAAMRNERIGFVFQFYHLLSEFTALENVMMPAMMSSSVAGCKSDRHSGKQAVKDRAVDILKSVGL